MAAITSINALRLARPTIDVSLFTNQIEPLLTFWRDKIGLTLEETLSIREGQVQYRHGIADSFVKIGHIQAPLPASPPSGFRELLIARHGQGAAQTMCDPDGNRVSLVAPGTFGVTQIGMRLHVRDVAKSSHFFTEVLGLPATDTKDGTAVSAGRSLLLISEDPSATVDPAVHGPGWRFMSLQVFDVRRLYSEIVARGGREGIPPKRLGAIARYALVRDPDGNWIELSQRAALTGPLGDDDEPG